MQYRLIDGSTNDTRNVIDTILQNRGVDPDEYLHLDESCVQDYNDLCNIQEAVACFVKHYEAHDKIITMPDQDVDGQTSCAVLYNYIKSLDPNYPIEVVYHERNKSHGLADADFTLPTDAKLFIIADAATNDVKECNALIDSGIDVICLDHHDEEPSDIKSKAIIVNNQMSPKYNNKELSGVGVTYRFCQAVDDELWENNADNFLDLVGLGLIGDLMDMRSYETRYLTDKGLRKINNKLFQALLDAQEYSTKGVISIHNMAFYIVPLINALIRVGSLEERQLMFRAFIQDYEEFDYIKRDGTCVTETIYERVARLCKNAKSRQDNQKKKLYQQLLDEVNLDDKVCIIEVTDESESLIGLSANALANEIKRPVVIVKEVEQFGKTSLKGSIRNFSNSPIQDLKETLLESGVFTWIMGHSNAAGCSLPLGSIDHAREVLNKQLQDVTYDSTFLCDFILDVNDMNIGLIQEIDGAKFLWCTGIKEPLVAVENVCVTQDDIHLKGAEFNTVSFTINDIEYIQFSCKEGDPLYDFAMSDDDEAMFNIVGECDINNFRGNYTPQIKIQGVIGV